jgi:YD repeat-containing protein
VGRKTVNPDGTETLSVYDALNRVIWSTNAFDPSNLSTAITTRTVYNQLGQTVGTQQYAGQLITVGTKTQGSSVTATTSVATVDNTADGPPSSGTLISTTTTAYDAQGNAIETTAANGLRTGSVYTPDGKVLYTGPLAPSAPTDGHTVTIAGGVSTQALTTADFTSYTETGPVQFDANLGLFYTRSVDQDDNATETYTDSQGRTVRTVYADGSFTETLYSVGQQAVAADQEGDAVPNPTGWTYIVGGGYEEVDVAQRKAGDAPGYTYDLYNADGELTDVWLPPVVDAGPNATTGTTPVNPHWTYTYDTAGNELTQVSGNGNAAGANPALFTTSWAYDQNGDKVRQLLPDGELQTWTYDVYGNNTSHKVYSATNHSTALQTTLDTYDTSAAHGGRLLVENRYSSDQPVGSTATPNERTTYTYDDSASLPSAEQTDQGNVAEVDDYALEGGSLQLIDFTHYTYDPISGGQATITTADGTIHYVYDEASGNLVETWTGANASAAKTSAQNDVLYGYDTQGRLKSVTQVVLNGSVPPSVAGGTRYDADGNPVATTQPTTVYSYDNAGNLLSDAEPNGDVTLYNYDVLNRLSGESVINSAHQLLFGENTYWADDGQKREVIDVRGDGAGGVTQPTFYNWTYDADGRLTGETLTVQAGGGPDVPPAFADTYAYDLDNNRVGKTVDGGALATGGSTVAYAYNGDDQLITETGTGALAYQTTSTYDADGNLSTQVTTGDNAEDDSYGYDLQNDMTSATVNDVTTNYTYDYNGVLTSETTAGATTYDLNDPNNPTGNSKAIQQSSTPGGAPTTSYVLGLQVEAQSDPTRGGTLYLLVDGHGSTRALAGTSGGIASGQTFDYDTFGDQLTNVGTADTDWLYGSGGVYDQSTGWTYNLARWLDGFTFTSSDTYGGSTDDPAGLNKYDYADADPMAGDDPRRKRG